MAAAAATAVDDDDEDRECLATVALYMWRLMLLTSTCVTQANKRR